MCKYLKIVSIVCCLLGFSVIAQTVKAGVICPRSAQYYCTFKYHDIYIYKRASVPTVYSPKYNICIPGQYAWKQNPNGTVSYVTRAQACAWAHYACNSQWPQYCNSTHPCEAQAGVGNVLSCDDVPAGKPVVYGPVNF